MHIKRKVPYEEYPCQHTDMMEDHEQLDLSGNTIHNNITFMVCQVAVHRQIMFYMPFQDFLMVGRSESCRTVMAFLVMLE